MTSATNFGQTPSKPTSVKYQLNFSVASSFTLAFGPSDMNSGFLAQFTIVDNSNNSQPTNVDIGGVNYPVAPFECAGFPVVMNALDYVAISSNGTSDVEVTFSNSTGSSFSRTASQPASEGGILKTISTQLPPSLSGFRLQVSESLSVITSGKVALGTVSVPYTCGASTFAVELYCRVGQARWSVNPTIPTSTVGSYIGIGERLRYDVAPGAVLNFIQSADATSAGFIEINECS